MSSDKGTSHQIPANELRHTLDLGKSTIRNWISRGKISEEHYTYRSLPEHGGKTLFIDPKGLPPEHLQVWVRARMEAGELPMPSAQEVAAHEWQAAKDWQKKTARLRYAFYKAVPASLSTDAKKAAIEQFKKSRPKSEWPTKKGGSLATWYRYNKEYQKHGLAGLLPDPPSGTGTSVQKQDYDVFKTYYLTRDQRSARACYRRVLGAAAAAGRSPEQIPGPQVFVDLVREREGEDQVFICRHGEEAFYQRRSPYTSRNWTGVPAGDVWFSDHRLFDQFVIDTRTGQVGRPWFTPWMDARSTYFLSWDVYLEHPNSDRIHLTLKRGIAEHGRPLHGYIDNGKDYRARDLTAGPQRNKKKQVPAEIDELRTENVFDLMGIDATFARPYNARAKTIERKFRYFIERMEKFGRTYAGSAPHQRPERTDKIVQAAKDNPERAVREGLLPTLQEFRSRVAGWVERINRTPSDGKILQGHSPKEIFYAKRGEERRVQPEHLGVLCMRTSSERLIRRCQWKDSELGITYTADWMYEPRVSGTKAYARRDPEQPDTAWIFDADEGSLLGVAHRKKEVPAMVDPETNPEGAEELAKQLKMNQAYVKHLTDKKKAIEANQPTEEESDELYDAWLQWREEKRREEGSYLQEEGPKEVTFERSERAAAWLDQADAQARTGTDDLPYEPADAAPSGDGAATDDMKLWPDE